VSTAVGGVAGPPWWALLPPAETQVACGEHTHRLRWAEGSLAAVDHPDTEGELVLAALGGDRSECVNLVEAWGRHVDDLEVLAVGPRSAADELALSPESIAELESSRSGWVGYASLSGRRFRFRSRPVPPWAQLARGAATFSSRQAARRRTAMMMTAAAIQARRRGALHSVAGAAARGAAPRPVMHAEAERARARRIELLSLLALGPGFQFRLSATVAAAWANGGSHAGDRDAGRPALDAALAGRLAPAAQAWLGVDPGQVECSLHEDAGWGRLALSAADGERRLSAALPAGWLASVWAAGLAVTAGHLIVAVTDAAWPDATVLGVPMPGADPVILTVRAVEENGEAGGGWTVPVTASDGDGAR
jgi:hypothetical protein